MEFLLIAIGIISALIFTFVGYIIYTYIRLRIHKNKIRNIYSQIKGQVNIKHVLLKEYIEMNKDEIDEKIYSDIQEKLIRYNHESNDIDNLKEHNYAFNHYMKSLNDDLLSRQCNKAEEKINHIKGYYNEVVNFYNNYKSNKVNSFVAKTLDFNDEKVY